MLSKSSTALPWIDTAGQLFVRAVRFYWSVPLRLPDFDVHPLQPIRPRKKAPPSIFNPVTQLRILKRGNRWIATHWDKRDDDLVPFDPIETMSGHPAVPTPPISLTQGSQTISVTLGPNQRVGGGPTVRTAEFVWKGEPTEPVAIRLHSPENVWRVRLGAIAAAKPPNPPGPSACTRPNSASSAPSETESSSTAGAPRRLSWHSCPRHAVTPEQPRSPPASGSKTSSATSPYPIASDGCEP